MGAELKWARRCMEVKWYFGTVSLNIYIWIRKAGGLHWKCQHACCFQGFILKSRCWKRCSACFPGAGEPPGSATAVFTETGPAGGCLGAAGSSRGFISSSLVTDCAKCPRRTRPAAWTEPVAPQRRAVLRGRKLNFLLRTLLRSVIPL